MQVWKERIQRWWQDPSIRLPLIVFITARLFTLIVATTAIQLGPVYNPYAADPIFLESMQGRQIQHPLYALIEPWHRWDTGWYLKIAVQGYAATDGTIIFGPLYPALIAAVRVVTGDVLFAGLLISSLACLGYLIIMYKLAYRETGQHSAAQNMLLALITFPTAFYLFAAYTESTYLFFTASAFYAARSKRWWWAAVLAACSSLTRLQGWILFFPIGWMMLMEIRATWPSVGWKDQVKQVIPALFATGSAPLMTATFLLGMPVLGLGSVSDAYETLWKVMVRAPWQVVFDTAGKIISFQSTPTELGGFIALLIIIVLAGVSISVLPFVYHLYIWPTLFFILLRYYPGNLLNGTMRYVLDFFPLFITAGMLFHQHQRLRWLWIVTGFVLQVVMLFLFARWQWIA